VSEFNSEHIKQTKTRAPKNKAAQNNHLISPETPDITAFQKGNKNLMISTNKIPGKSYLDERPTKEHLAGSIVCFPVRKEKLDSIITGPLS